MFNLTKMEYNSKEETLTISKMGNKIELTLTDMMHILDSGGFKPFFEAVDKERKEWR